MKARVLPFVLCVLSYAVGVATGAGMSSRMARRESGEVSAPRRTVRGAGRIADTDDATKTAALEARVRTLQRRLDELLCTQTETMRQGETAILEKAAVVQAAPQAQQTHRERMERMRLENPEQYRQMTNNIAQWRQAGFDRAVGRLDALASVNVSGWSRKAQDTHREYQELLARREELFEVLRPENEDEGSRQEAHEELRRVSERLNRLGDEERVNLLDATAKGFGLTGKESDELVETVRAVYDVTSDGFGFRGPGGRHGGGRRREGRGLR